ncbi:MAG: alpha/beta hydrolase [Oscillospiraceae bacterium]|nr:alpha/beta hydrolase [Oscillospiraceae bacterium]
MDVKEELAKYYKRFPKKQISIKGKPFEYRYLKNADADKTLIFLTGGLGLSDLCYRYVSEFSKDFSVAVFDYPVAFRSNEQLADAIAVLIKYTEMKNVWLVGQSYGGMIAQVTAKRHPECVNGLVLSNTGTLASDMKFDGIENLYAMMKKAQKFRDKYDKHMPMFILKPMLRQGIKMKLGKQDKSLCDFIMKFMDCAFDQYTNEYLWHMDNLLADLRNEWGFKPEDFAYLKGKVLLMLSDDDKTFNQDVKDSLIKVMPQPKVRTDLTGGHLAMFFCRDEYMKTVRKFIKEA